METKSVRNFCFEEKCHFTVTFAQIYYQHHFHTFNLKKYSMIFRGFRSDLYCSNLLFAHMVDTVDIEQALGGSGKLLCMQAFLANTCKTITSFLYSFRFVFFLRFLFFPPLLLLLFSMNETIRHMIIWMGSDGNKLQLLTKHQPIIIHVT